MHALVESFPVHWARPFARLTEERAVAEVLGLVRQKQNATPLIEIVWRTLQHRNKRSMEPLSLPAHEGFLRL